jgi:O-antigen/teichoic acid export membrane protein
MTININKNLIKGSLILFISFNIFNALNFFYHFGMARMLTVIDYGILVTLFSIIYILAVFTESIQLVITKYSANEEDEGKLKNIIKRAFKKSFLVSIVLFVMYLGIAIPLSTLLKIDYVLIVLMGVMIFFVFLSPINRGIMQGRKRFTSLGLNVIIEGVIKISLGIWLVFLGWKVFGAIVATLIGAFVAFLFSFVSIRDLLFTKEKEAETRGIYGYTKPTFLVNMAILMFFSIDVLIVKIYFSETLAGTYAIASVLAKTIFLGTQPIARAMFPLSAGNKKKSKNVFLNSFAIISIVVAVALAIFYFFPELIIKIFSGKVVIESARILFYLGVAIGILSLANLVLFYKLSQGEIKGTQYLLLVVIIEAILLSYFSKDLVQFSIAFITSAAAFLCVTIFLTGNK